MKTAYRIPRKRATKRRKRPHVLNLPKRVRDPRFLDPRSYVTKGGRFRLDGDDYQLLRWKAFSRAQAMCECGCNRFALWRDYVLPDTGELSHNEHGARKSDELDRVKWMRHECHMKSHNCGGKPVPKKPERMSA